MMFRRRCSSGAVLYLNQRQVNTTTTTTSCSPPPAASSQQSVSSSPSPSSSPSGVYRSAAALKLKELQERFKIFPTSPSEGLPVTTVLDLAAAPGGFTQVALECMHKHTEASSIPPLVIAVDLQRMHPLPGCRVLRSNTMDHQRIKAEVRNVVSSAQRRPLPQVVLHDGVSLVEGQSELSVTYAQSNMAISAARLAVDLFEEATSSSSARRRGGDGKSGTRASDLSSTSDLSSSASLTFVTKAMPSQYWNTLLDVLQHYFAEVHVARLASSRADSKEQYMVARRFMSASERQQRRRRQSVKTNKYEAASEAEGRLFSLEPREGDIRKGRQVMWHCFGCRTMRLGCKPCPLCKGATSGTADQSLTYF